MTKDKYSFKNEEDIAGLYKNNPVAYNHFCSMNTSWRKRMTDYMLGKKTLPITYDPFFKLIFNPDLYPNRLSGLISSILDKKVTVERILPSEEVTIDGGALLIMDIVIRLNDGSLANVEIQKIPYYFPAERISCYSADLLLREYSRIKSECSDNNKKFTYTYINKVYTIVIFEESNALFNDPALNGKYLHHGTTVFDTNLKLNMLQEYYLISLDVFKNRKYTRTISELNGWLSLLSVEDMNEVDEVIRNYPWTKEIYEQMTEYTSNHESILYRFSDALRILDRNTAELMVDEYKAEIARKEKEIADKDREIAELKKLISQQHN